MLSCVGYPRCYLLSSAPAYISFFSAFFLFLFDAILRVLPNLYILCKAGLKDMNEDTESRELSIILASCYSLTLSPDEILTDERRKVVCTDEYVRSHLKYSIEHLI